MTFSERLGFRQKTEIIQLTSMDDALRAGLWNSVHLTILEKEENRYDNSLENSNMKWFFRSIWHNHFKRPVDTLPYSFKESVKQLREEFFNCKWNECFDLVEFIASVAGEWKDEYLKFSNRVLEKNLCGYRFIGITLSPVSTPEETAEVERALTNKSLNSGARAHLQSALKLLADRESPNHRNSIKESISAVESTCQQMTGNPKATLGDALKILERSGSLHSALKTSFSSLYGYTSDADGIRHAMMDDSRLTSADSRFMLISCSAFVNYLTDKSGR